jgi:hypothetical protein
MDSRVILKSNNCIIGVVKDEKRALLFVVLVRNNDGSLDKFSARFKDYLECQEPRTMDTRRCRRFLSPSSFKGSKKCPELSCSRDETKSIVIKVKGNGTICTITLPYIDTKKCLTKEISPELFDA